MARLGKTLEQFKALRRKFETLLAAQQGKSPLRMPRPAQNPQRLRELSVFGSNPGNLRMRLYVPRALPASPGLVVALHGCTQTADDYDLGSGWSSLADRLGFVVVYPQQQPANNPKTCFSWFLPNDIARDCGEALSIRQMIERAIADFGVDRARVFVTGLSSGGAMASVMLATYPEVFAAGAIIAGLAYGSAASLEDAFVAMFTEQPRPARALGDRVRAASRHRGPWPKISVWHGTADAIVTPANADNILKQWIDVHGLEARAAREETIAGHRRRVWTDAGGEALIEAIFIGGMAHGVPIAWQSGTPRGGVPGP